MDGLTNKNAYIMGYNWDITSNISYVVSMKMRDTPELLF